MNITSLKRLNVQYEDNKKSHTVYLNPEDNNLLVLKYDPENMRLQKLEESAQILKDAIESATDNRLAIFCVSNEFEIEIINLGKHGGEYMVWDKEIKIGVVPKNKSDQTKISYAELKDKKYISISNFKEVEGEIKPTGGTSIVISDELKAIWPQITAMVMDNPEVKEEP